MKFLRNRRGFSFIELVVAMAIMGILGTIIAGLARTGFSSYGQISSDMAYETEARAALSLITVQLRQHDETGAITVDSLNKRIRLKNSPPSAEGTLIWFDGGVLYSVETSNVNSDEDMDKGVPVASIFDLQVLQFTDLSGAVNTYEVTITYGQSGERTLSETVTQRSIATEYSAGP